MILDLNDDQLELILKHLAKAHVIAYWKNSEDENDLKEFLEFIIPVLNKSGKNNIVEKIFERFDKK